MTIKKTARAATLLTYLESLCESQKLYTNVLIASGHSPNSTEIMLCTTEQMIRTIQEMRQSLTELGVGGDEVMPF